MGITKCFSLLLGLTTFIVSATLGSPARAENDEPRILVDGMPIVSSTPAFIQQDRILVPVRAVTEGLGAQVEWDAQERAVTVRGNYHYFQVWIGGSIAIVDGIAVALDVPALLVADRTYLPLRLTVESLGAKVTWDSASRTASIVRPTLNVIDELHSPLDRSGVWETDGKGMGPHSGRGIDPSWYPPVRAPKTFVHKRLVQSSAKFNEHETVTLLGKGICMDEEVKVEKTESIKLSNSLKLPADIGLAFEFSTSGTRSFKNAYKLCGPPDNSNHDYRVISKVTGYNRYQVTVKTEYYGFLGRVLHTEEETYDNVLVPFLALLSTDGRYGQ